MPATIAENGQIKGLLLAVRFMLATIGQIWSNSPQFMNTVFSCLYAGRPKPSGVYFD